MAYVPTLKDFEETEPTGGFKPSLSDFEENPQKNLLTNLDRLAAIPKNLIISSAQEIPRAIGGLASLPQLIGLKNPLSSEYQIAGLGKNPFGVKEYEVPGYEKIKETPEAKAVQYGADYGPLAALGVGGLGYGVSKTVPLLKKVKPLTDILTGKNVANISKKLKGRSAENIEKLKKSFASKEDAEIAKIVPELKQPFAFEPRVSKEAKNLGDISHEVLSDYYGTKNYQNLIGKEHISVGKEIKNNYNAITKDLNKKYESFLDKNGEKNLVPMGVKLKSLKIGNYLRGFNEDNVLNKSYKNFLNEPNISNAHSLQSKLGNKIATMYEKRPAERDVEGIDKLKNARNWLQEKISDVGGKEYRNITKEWKENVIPYHEDSIINKAVRKNIASESLSKRLSRFEINEEERSPIRKIVSHMSETQKRKVLSNIVKNAVSTEGEINVDKLHDALKSIKSKGFGEFVTKKDIDYIERLNKSNKAIEGLMKEQKDFSNLKKEHALKIREAKAKIKEKNIEKIEKRKRKWEKAIAPLIEKEQTKSIYGRAATGVGATLLGESLIRRLVTGLSGG